MSTSNKKRLLILGLIFLILAITALTIIAKSPIAIEQSVNGAHIEYRAQPRITSRQTCTTLSWNVTGARQVSLNDVNVADSGEKTFCWFSSLPSLGVVFADSSGQDFSLPILYVPIGPVALVCIAIMSYTIYTARYLRLFNIPSTRVAPTQSRLAAYTRWVFAALCIGFAAVAMIERARVAFGVEYVLHWDETYYASIAATTAHGLGIYPYVQGYAQIPNMGGIGHFVLLYVMAYQLLGPSIFSLRLIAYLASIVALVGIFFLTRRRYGSAAGLAAVALTPWLGLFQRFNTVRPDITTMAFATWAFVLFEHTYERKQTYWPYLVGFVCAMGLEFHLHTIAAACACGVVYLVETIPIVRETKTWRALFSSSVARFAGGYAVGAILFAALNILPYPEGFFQTAGQARLSSANISVFDLTARMDIPKLIQTFVSPLLMLPKEVSRYSDLFISMGPLEALLWVTAFPVLLVVRQKPDDLRAKWLLVGGMVGGAFIFINDSALYLASIYPLFIPVVASLITHGFGAGEPINWRSVSAASCVFLFVVGALFILSSASQPKRPVDGLTYGKEYPALVPQVEEVKARASTECIIAGPTDYYAHYFMRYPKFVGARLQEIQMGSTYYDLSDDLVRYWEIKRPDILFGPLVGDLDKYVVSAQYTEIAEGIWQKPSDLSPGCVIRSH